MCFWLFFCCWHNLFNEVLHKSKALKRQIWAIISNTISTTPILGIDYFTGSKGIWSWQSNIGNDKGTGLEVDSGLRESRKKVLEVRALLCHTNTMLKRVQNLQNIEIPPAVLSCNIHVDTIETTVFSRVLMSTLAVKGWGAGRVEEFTPLLQVPEKRWHRFSTLLPRVTGPKGRRFQLEFGGRYWIRRIQQFRFSCLHTSYLGVTSNFTK